MEGPVGRIGWGRCGGKKSTFPKGVTDLPQMVYRTSAEKLADGGFDGVDDVSDVVVGDIGAGGEAHADFEDGFDDRLLQQLRVHAHVSGSESIITGVAPR